MLLVLGGAPRAGKGIISRRCTAAALTPVLSLDVLKMGLHHAVPSLGIQPGDDPSEVGVRMWPLVRAMAENVLECRIDYLFEGDMLVPSQVKELEELGGGDVRSCFVGYRHIEPRQKLSEIRRHAGLPNDWLTEHDDEYILEVVEYGIGFSRRLNEECEDLGVPYFDGSTDFMGAVEAATSYLTGGG